MKLDHSSNESQVPLIPLQGKIELLRESIGEVQKYELLTTNQYLQQMELLIEILDDVSIRAESRTSIFWARAVMGNIACFGCDLKMSKIRQNQNVRKHQEFSSNSVVLTDGGDLNEI